MTEEHVHVSDLRWDRLLAGELADAEKAEVLAGAAACAACRARLATLRGDSEAFAQRAPIELTRRPSKKWWLAAPALLAAAAAVVLIVRTGPEPTAAERPKGGGPRLIVEAGRQGQLAPVAAGDRVYPGDFVQAGYSAARAGFGAVLSRDGSGKASIYVPAAGDAMVALPAGELQSYPGSTVLDSVVGDEALIVIWCESARPLAPLVTELEARGDIAAPAGCTHRRVVLDKRAERE